MALLFGTGVGADLAGKDGKCNTFIGSPYWLAPEVIMAMEDGLYRQVSSLPPTAAKPMEKRRLMGSWLS